MDIKDSEEIGLERFPPRGLLLLLIVVSSTVSISSLSPNDIIGSIGISKPKFGWNLPKTCRESQICIYLFSMFLIENVYIILNK